MITQIYCQNSWRNITLNDYPRTSRMLNTFLMYNNVYNRFYTIGGGWYILKGNKFLYVTKRLTDLTFQEWYDIATNINFKGKIKQ